MYNYAGGEITYHHIIHIRYGYRRYVVEIYHFYT